MKNTVRMIALVLSLVLFARCGVEDQVIEADPGSNPFLDKGEEGKADSGYVNLRGVEVHVTLETDIQTSSWSIFNAPAEHAQFALTYLRKRNDFYLEILAEDTTTADRVEWLVDGAWLGREEAGRVDREKLTHFRLREVNAVVLNRRADNVTEGQVFEAKVPLKPMSVYQDAGDKCADYNSHIDLGQSVYWYLWNPGRSGCAEAIELTTMTLTVDEVLPHNPESYPEYDQLWADGRLDAVVLFGKLDDGDVEDDYNWRNVRKLAEWLTEAGFSEQEEAPLGRRFVRQVGELSEVIDIYGPDIFHNVADYSRLRNWQKAVAEHEVVMYNGHSVLGTGMAFERAQYPDFYQIFQVASCLSYEYYVRPVLSGKGSWESVDVISNVQPTYYSENLPLTSTILAKLMQGFENNGNASWQDIMEAVSRKLGHSRFGVSGARGNCFSPDGDRCDPDPDPDPDVLRFENTTPLTIPDNDPVGVKSIIEIPDSAVISSLDVEIDLTHTYIGDLHLVLTHNGAAATLWNRSGGSDNDIRANFQVTDFNTLDAAGTWELRVVDHAGWDTGTLNNWALVVHTGEAPDPGLEPLRYESSPAAAIPDNDATGVTSAINVTDQVTVASLAVEIDITHTYIGDLKIVLQHNGTERALWNREGGGSDDIRKTFQVTDFNGADAAGTWSLRIVDEAGLDTGTLNRWALVVTPAG